ncbi:LOG family protein [Terribacillus saccharophilus]|uniref:Cytokinin riboside 5'-monophosphate phosphoribohydrolase n=1 Tax=Terribacillus saccharophilus TaxID=361277 RepID=A0A075LNE2_9BACI|nr:MULTISPECIES: TIGR00730 family Rossman fold protein [Terribacillus]AIF67621.1 decarboxylase [Terribacillus goriensis]MEC0281684.1 TIGR00730 family Rossman fold protein [Terribacillus saccharophilus]MEC0291528.1 TIGR00730 family Rossman fold protein [Terribacillus saccharophilus]
MKAIAVYCGSSNGVHPIYKEEAVRLGKYLAEQGLDLIYGGATVGCMGAVADAVMEAGGRVIGVIPEKLKQVEIAHQHLTELHVVETMHERKALMADLADGFIAMPGGTGTLEEWFEMFTWAQLGYHEKPCALLNTNEYYTPMLSLFDHMIEQGFIKADYKELILMEQDPTKLVDTMLKYEPAYIHKW